MMRWSTECKDWEKKIISKQSLIPLPLYSDVAEIAIEVFGNLIVPDIEGCPRMRDIMPSWVFDFVAAIFGALDPETRRREIKKFFLLISKKNGKSTIAAGIMLTALELNERNMTEAVILAPTKKIAGNSFDAAKGMIDFDPDGEMQQKYNISAHTKTITHLSTKSTLQVIAADDKTAGGSKAAFVLIDEQHLFGEMASAESIITEATGGLTSKPDGFIIILSTQSSAPPAGVFKTELNYARAVRDGQIMDKNYLPVLYEFPQSMLDDKSYKKPKNFYVTNPSLGYSVDESYLVSKSKQDALKGVEAVQEFEAKHLNKEVGLNLRSDRWSGADVWEGQADKTLTLESLLDRCEVVDIGIDGGGLDDLLGLAVVGRETGTGKWLTWCKAWANSPVLERRKDIVTQLEDFSKAGEVSICDVVGEDVAQVAAICSHVFKFGLLDQIGVDQAGLGGIIQAIDEAGVPKDLIIGIPQGWKLTGAIKTTERALAANLLLHADQGLMTWCVSNAKVEPRGNAIMITKQNSGSAKIDALMALFNAITLLALTPKAKRRNIDNFLNNYVIG